jgi:predicted nuclease with TOPRIM domain
MTYEELQKEYDQIKVELAAVEEERDEYKKQVSDLKGDIDDYIGQIDELEAANAQLERDAEGVIDTNEIKLSGGEIYVNLDGLDYTTRESFKDWCRQHAITNSEPTFNL